MDNFEAIFNSKPAINEQQQMNSTEFRPKPGKSGPFSAVIRFLPNPIEPVTMSIISKYVVYLEHPKTRIKRGIDCPSSIGQPSSLTNTFFALRNSSNPILQENSKQFSRKQQFASLIQVLDCKSDPSLVNKILVWRYGIKIYEKIQQEMTPVMNMPAKEPFNPITGRPFNVLVKEVSNFPNYDGCNFIDLDISVSGMRIPMTNAQGQMQWNVVTGDLTAKPEGRQMVFNYIKENAPDMERYKYHEWDTETTTFVNECIQIYSNPTATIQAMSAQPVTGMGMPQSSMASQAATMPTVAAPASLAMAMPGAMPQAMPMQQAQPAMPMATMPAMPSMDSLVPPTPTNPMAMPAMPTIGLNEVPSMNVGAGFNAPVMGEDINSLIGVQTPAATTQPDPTLNLDLSDVLNNQFIGGN